jgi:hypothetical protein
MAVLQEALHDALPVLTPEEWIWLSFGIVESQNMGLEWIRTNTGGGKRLNFMQDGRVARN